MSLEIDFAAQKTYTQTLQIQDQGNTCIQCVGEDKNAGPVEYYLFVKTIMGKTAILTVGPIPCDFSFLVNGFNVSVKIFKYSEKTIKKEISSFLNNSSISDAFEIPIAEGLKKFPDIVEMFTNL